MNKNHIISVYKTTVLLLKIGLKIPSSHGLMMNYCLGQFLSEHPVWVATSFSETGVSTG